MNFKTKQLLQIYSVFAAQVCGAEIETAFFTNLLQYYVKQLLAFIITNWGKLHTPKTLTKTTQKNRTFILVISPV